MASTLVRRSAGTHLFDSPVDLVGGYLGRAGGNGCQTAPLTSSTGSVLVRQDAIDVNNTTGPSHRPHTMTNWRRPRGLSAQAIAGVSPDGLCSVLSTVAVQVGRM